MLATKIKMKSGCGTSNNLLEIDSIYLTGATQDGFYSKGSVHDFLEKNPGQIQVNINPYPNVIPATSVNGEKYVKSTPNDSKIDNLLCLPRV